MKSGRLWQRFENFSPTFLKIFSCCRHIGFWDDKYWDWLVLRTIGLQECDRNTKFQRWRKNGINSTPCFFVRKSQIHQLAVHILSHYSWTDQLWILRKTLTVKDLPFCILILHCTREVYRKRKLYFIFRSRKNVSSACIGCTEGDGMFYWCFLSWMSLTRWWVDKVPCRSMS